MDKRSINGIQPILACISQWDLRSVTPIALTILVFLIPIACNLIISFYNFLQNKQRSRLQLPPGPPTLPLLGNIHQLGKLPHQSLAHLATIYGPIMYLRLGSIPAVVVSSPAMATQVLKVHDHALASRPKTSAVKYMLYDGATIAFGPYDAEWRLKRKICTFELFTSKKLREQADIRREEISALLKSIHNDALGGHAVNVSKKFPVAALNVVSRMMLGRRMISRRRQDDQEQLLCVLKELISLSGVFNIQDFIPKMQWFDPLRVKARMKVVHQRLDSILEDIIRERKSESPAAEGMKRSKDLLDVLISHHSDEPHDNNTETYERLSWRSIKGVVLDMFLGGTDTSSHTINWAMAELMNPITLEKAQQEIDSIVGNSRKVEEFDLEEFKFLRAIVKETLRLHPIVPMLVPRESMQSCEIEGYSIPQSTRIFVNVWAIGHDSQVWEDPLKFDPQRFLLQSQHISETSKGLELISFGGGRRICPGMSLGLCVVQYALACLLHCFDWALPEGQLPEHIDVEEVSSIVLLKKRDLSLVPMPRNVTYLYLKDI